MIFIRKKISCVLISTLLLLLVTVKIFADSEADTKKTDVVTHGKGQTYTTTEVSDVINKGLKNYISSDEYKTLELKSDLEKELGIKIKELQPIVCKITYYSSLACENGVYGLKTASGIDMNNKTVANNFLEFGTDLYIKGHGHKIVQDTGSKKHFNTVNRFDVYVPRNENESDDLYYKRVNDMGRKTKVGYIIVKG